jgi:hypothetical protein
MRSQFFSWWSLHGKNACICVFFGLGTAAENRAQQFFRSPADGQDCFNLPENFMRFALLHGVPREFAVEAPA